MDIILNLVITCRSLFALKIESKDFGKVILNFFDHPLFGCFLPSFLGSVICYDEECRLFTRHSVDALTNCEC